MYGSGEITEFQAAQYVRMSTEHQQYSTHNQSDKIREYTEKRGIKIIKTYANDGKSGLTTGGRATLQQLIADVDPRRRAHASEQDREDVKADRAAWALLQPGLDPAKLIFLDETGTSTKMARRHGRSPRGELCQASVPHGHWKTTTLVAGLRLGDITAPAVIDGAMDGELFTLYAEHFLALNLNKGDIVILDDLPAHEVTRAREVIEVAGATLLFLPPYSPDFNSIEQAFAKIKALLRKTAARTVEALETAIANALEAFTPDECANCFENSGYEPN